MQFADDQMGDLPSWVALVLPFVFGSKNTDGRSAVSKDGGQNFSSLSECHVYFINSSTLLYVAMQF